MKFIKILPLIIFFSTNISAQTWVLTTLKKSKTKFEGYTAPSNFTSYKVDINKIMDILESTKLETDINLSNSQSYLDVALPNEDIIQFQIVEYKMLDTELSKKYPNLRTYYGKSLDKKSKIRIDWTFFGFRAMITQENKTIIINPIYKNNPNYLASYYIEDDFGYSDEFICQAKDTIIEIEPTKEPIEGNCKFKTLRLAISTMAQYSNHIGAKGPEDEEMLLSEIISTINQVNAIMENDIGIRLILINNTTSLFYYDKDTHPFNGTETLLSQNKKNTNKVIGADNFDIGHLFKKPAGGVAILKGVCKNGKASGTSGRGKSRSYHFRVILHEMGHQMGAAHTQNNDCNRANGSSVEPGSGSTLMGYPGVCKPNIIGKPDLYYHGKSLQQIWSHMSTKYCSTIINESNTAPTVDAGDEYTIPISTPFVLTSTYDDIDGDSVTIAWEQYDSEVGIMPPKSTNLVGPVFRSFPPSTSPKRYFPKINKIIENDLTSNWQCLPSVGRTMKFRVSARDNAVGGCIASDNTKITFSEESGPFIVQTPISNDTIWEGNSTKSVIWDVANTNTGDVNCQNIDILLSTDGGYHFYDTLAINIQNDGEALITLPNINTTKARFMVKASNNIFFAISSFDFEITEIDTSITQTINIGTELRVYPNPCIDKLYFNFSRQVKNISSLQIVNILGQQIKTFPIKSDTRFIDISDLKPNMYFIKSKSGVTLAKFIKK